MRGEPLLEKRKARVEFPVMKVFSALLLVCLSGYAATQMEVEKRVPAKLGHVARIKEKNPHYVLTVRGTNGDVLAQLSKVVLDDEGQRPKFAVLQLFENVTQNPSFIVVPWETLTVNTDTADFFIGASADKLRQAPTIRADDVPDRAPPNWGSEYYTLYGVQPQRSDPEANAVGTAALVSGVVKGSGSSRESATPVVDVHRGDTVYICLALILVLFGVGMLSRRRARDDR